MDSCAATDCIQFTYICIYIEIYKYIHIAMVRDQNVTVVKGLEKKISMSCMHITYPFCKFSLFSTTVLNHVNVFWRYNLHIMPEARSILAGPIQPHVLANLLLRSYRKPMDAT